jgi:hypothetical protein
MTKVLTVRLPTRLAQDFKAKTRSAGTTPSAVLRRFASEYVKARKQPDRNVLQEHILSHAGRWEGHCSGVELLRKTRP